MAKGKLITVEEYKLAFKIYFAIGKFDAKELAMQTGMSESRAIYIMRKARNFEYTEIAGKGNLLCGYEEATESVARDHRLSIVERPKTARDMLGVVDAIEDSRKRSTPYEPSMLEPTEDTTNMLVNVAVGMTIAVVVVLIAIVFLTS